MVTNDRERQGTEALYRLEGVRFAADGRDILGPIDAVFERGRIHGLIGPNGSGKSTLMRMLARQERPSAGRVLFRGEDVFSFSERTFARQVAYMAQFAPAAEGLTVEELVALGRFPWHGALGRFSDTDAEKVEEALAATGLGPLQRRLVDSLSGGERQRAWLAVMIAQEAGCLLLDEPTSALDVAHEVEMLTLLHRMTGERGVTAIVVLHDINMATRICDALVALRDGVIVAEGPPEQVMRSDVLARIYGIGMGILEHPRTGAPIGYVE
ncbi:ATP-binding cassette domain-containing protein [Chelativorans sp. M5D2P16]|uniref:ATP-binding cassette domain-containing protein n=1 Tax=Chelativorans sp. M5D2P16 TaxID=3095678 RepID=UPI002ACACA1C|nr:ATP-binding cassette domain-containing protein [Chelativorans sp. M5D2P16]MDZ5699738.1 ATP-binding cassette domain-containing protein [Chelativorans sp. M5D2P16]